MATVKVKGLSQIQSNIRKFITKELRKKELRQGVGNLVVASIRAKSLGMPATSTRKWRKKYDSLNTTHPTYGRNKINITFTGELLEDLQKNVKSQSTGGKFVYVIKHSDKLHKKYNGVSGKIGTRTKYSTISDGLINKWGYDYLTFDDKTLTKVVSYINKEITKSFKNFGK
jgi:hypothetical protein